MPQAEALCNEALTIDPDCDVAVATLAQLSLQQGKIDEAIKWFEKSGQLARTEGELANAITCELDPAAVQIRLFGEADFANRRTRFPSPTVILEGELTGLRYPRSARLTASELSRVRGAVEPDGRADVMEEAPRSSPVGGGVMKISPYEMIHSKLLKSYAHDTARPRTGLRAAPKV